MTMTFGEALEQLKLGRAVSRLGWKNRDIVVRLQRPDENSKMTDPYFYTEEARSERPEGGHLHLYTGRVPITLDAAEILQTDWVVDYGSNHAEMEVTEEPEDIVSRPDIERAKGGGGSAV